LPTGFAESSQLSGLPPCASEHPASPILLQREPRLVEPRVQPPGHHELPVHDHLDDPPLAQHQDPVGWSTLDNLCAITNEVRPTIPDSRPP